MEKPELSQAREAIEANERWLRDLLDAVPAAIYTTDAVGRVTSCNQAAADLAGRTPELGSDRWCVSWRLYWPDGRLMRHDQCPMAQALREQRPVHGAEVVLERPDGMRVPIMPHPTPLFDENGRLIGAVNMLVDVSERKQAEENRQLMIRELNHRVKNTLATVQAIASQTLRRATSPADFVWSFSGRLEALAWAHSLLTDKAWQGAEVTDLVRDQLLLDGADDERITCSGPSLILEPQAALHMALVLHELGTNARRYGALSVPDGRLAISWALRTSGGRDFLLSWKESGGPKVSAPAEVGFGTSLIEQSLEAHGGEAAIHYAAEGVSCDIRLPLPDRAPPRPVMQAPAPPMSSDAGVQEAIEPPRSSAGNRSW